MAKRNQRKNNKHPEPIRIEELPAVNTVAGPINTSLLPLLDQIQFVPRPANPWIDAEEHRRWEQSRETGHLQLALKCQNCSLEFLLLTLRTESEFLKRYKPEHGPTGGLCAAVHCPECGQKGKNLLLGYRRMPGIIGDFVGQVVG